MERDPSQFWLLALDLALGLVLAFGLWSLVSALVLVLALAFGL